MASTSKDTPAKGTQNKKGWLLRGIALLLVCLLALAGGLVASVGPSRVMALIIGAEPQIAEPPVNDGSAHEGDQDTKSAGHNAEPVDDIVVTPFQEIIVNITSTTATGRQTVRFLKLNLALAYDSTLPGAENIERRKLFLRDSFQDYLRQLNESDLQGTAGLVRLRAELMRRTRAIAETDAPKEFLIADLIVQ